MKRVGSALLLVGVVLSASSFAKLNSSDCERRTAYPGDATLVHQHSLTKAVGFIDEDVLNEVLNYKEVILS